MSNTSLDEQIANALVDNAVSYFFRAFLAA
jgi:hypothetical protein